ncbi:MAG: hypothetical protein K0S00_4466 [Xanthobacteraceae bacterium]|nr:hypothetical protein [Xanthobacteraceae bacterium]
MSALPTCEPPVGSDKIRYLVFVQGKWRWRPTAAMKRHGFHLVTFGRTLTDADRLKALALNRDWDQARRGIAVPKREFPVGSVGDGYSRVSAMRATDRKARGVKWTSEQASRDDWPRAWKWLGPVFGDTDPRTIEPETMQDFRARIAAKVSDSEAFRTIKVWRALWKKMAVMGYCDLERDPSLANVNTAPPPRDAVWTDHEVKRLVQRAWRLDYRGLAACMAVAWDSQFSPVDTRTLTPAQRRQDVAGSFYAVDRAKTGRAAAGTLSQWAEAILQAYLHWLDVELMENAPIFRTRHILPTIKGGRSYLPRPYTKDKLGKDFAVVRADLFGDDEKRLLSDMRRSGTVEAFAGGAEPGGVSVKMANTLAASSRLQKTYNPVNVATVRQVDEAREVGRARIREQKAVESVTAPVRKVSRIVGRSTQVLEKTGGSDGARTRDLRRDRPAL